MDEEELEKIINELKVFESIFRPTLFDTSLDGSQRAQFKRLVLEAKTILTSTIGAANDFSYALFRLSVAPSLEGIRPRPNLDDVQQATMLVQGGLNELRRKNSRGPSNFRSPAKDPYVAAERILQLRNVKPGRWDLRRLVRMLEELNLAHQQEAHVSTAMLVRAITDHIPPIFNHKTFTEVANNHPGGRSFGEQMQHLNTSLRKVADGLLHQTIRQSESLPLAPQVDFRAGLDVLLGEVVRVMP